MEKKATQSAKPKHKYRISDTAVGKILTDIIISSKNNEISHKQFHDLMLAAYSYIESDFYRTDEVGERFFKKYGVRLYRHPYS